MIASMKGYLYTIGQWITLAYRVIEETVKLPQTDEHGETLRESTLQNRAALVAVFGDGSRKNPFTEAAEIADADRDATIARISKFLSGAQYDFEEVVAQAASALYNTLSRHSYGATDASYEDQSAVSDALLDDLATEEMKKNAQIVGISNAIETFGMQQKAFEDVHQRKRHYATSKSDEKAMELLEPLKTDLSEFIGHINSKLRFYPEEYKQIATNINRAVEEINAKAQARRSRGSDGDDESADGTDGGSGINTDTGAAQTGTGEATAG